MRERKNHRFHNDHKGFLLIAGLCLLFLTALHLAIAAEVQAELQAKLQARIVTERQSNTSSPVVVVDVHTPQDYHAYAHDAKGRPLKLSISPRPAGSARVQTLYPAGHAITDPLDPARKVNVLDGTFSIFARLFPESEREVETLLLNVSMLLCSEQNCVPFDQNLALPVPPADSLPLIDAATQAGLAAAIPVKTLPLPASDTVTRPGTNLAGSPSRTEVPPHGTAASSPSPGRTLERLRLAPGTPQKTAPPSPYQFTPQYHAQSLEPESLLFALVLGLVAGLTLNVMPCVLPVLMIKITGLLSFSAFDKNRIKPHFRRYNLFFAAGVMVWFALLALLMAGVGLAWGGLFQQKELVFGLMMLTFLLGLSLFEVFALPIPGFQLRGASQNRPDAEAFLSGMTVTLLATPCSGPLLGGVLAFAALQSTFVQVLIFVCTGLGMALPYIALAAFPGMAKFLPKPGAWMITVERIAGFFLMGTALYLLSILPESIHLASLCALLASAFAAWFWGRFASLKESAGRRLVTGCLCLACVVVASFCALTPSSQPSAHWEAFSPARFASGLGKKPLLVEFTADWCPTCKALEKTTLRPERLQKLAQKYNLALIRVDLTEPNPHGNDLLKALGSVSIPLTAIFPAGNMSQTPVVLRDIYTFSQLETALSAALDGEKQ